jgi:N6-adenosine-specific RNA methylase IME4
MKFQLVVADPSWSFSDKLKMSSVPRGAEANYPTLSTKDIAALPVKDIADPTGCLLALWVPSSLLQDGLDVMKAWGFQQRQTYIWAKSKKEPFKSAISTLVDHMEDGIEYIEKHGIKKY